MRTYVYVEDLELPRNITLKRDLFRDTNTVDLDRGESKTMMLGIHLPSGMRPSKADIAVISEYQTPWIPFRTFHRVFRFKGVNGDTWQWQSQPSAEIINDVDAALGW